MTKFDKPYLDRCGNVYHRGMGVVVGVWEWSVVVLLLWIVEHVWY